MRKESTIDGIFEQAFGVDKTASVAKIIKSPLGRVALRHGIPTVIGGYTGWKMTPIPEEQFRAAAKGALSGALLGFGARKGLELTSPKHFSFFRRAQDLAKTLPKKQGERLLKAVGKIGRRAPLTTRQAKRVAKHMAPTLPVLGGGAAAMLAAKHGTEYLLPPYLGVTPVRHVPPSYMRKVSYAQLLEKIAAARAKKEDKPSYLTQVGRGAVPFGVKSLADIPKGTIEHAVERRAKKALKVPVKSVKGAVTKADATKGLKRFGGGAAMGVLTGPIFISGIKKMQSKDPSERAKGAAQVVGSGMIYQAAKGGAEAFKPGKKFVDVLRSGRARAIVNIPAALGAAYGAAKGTKADKGKKPSWIKGALYGAAGGAAGGFAKGFTEPPLMPTKKGKKPFFKQTKRLRRMAAKGLGRAAAGAAGGAVLGSLFKWISKSMSGKKPKKLPEPPKIKKSDAYGIIWGPHTGWDILPPQE